MDPSIKKLGPTVSKLINTTQIITSPTNVVKELIENSLDADATSIVVKLESFGLVKVEVTDNGSGVTVADAPFMALDGHTSKIRDHSDLERLQTYGFRGQGLSAIASLADVTVSTKPEGAEAGTTYVLNDNGKIVHSSPCSMNRGTIVLVTQLFRNIPVRHKLYSATKSRKEELKKMEELLKSYGIVRHNVRFMLYHDKIPILQKAPACDVASSLRLVLGSTVSNLLERTSYRSADDSVVIQAFLPKVGSSVSTMGRTQTDMTYIFVNRRPVKLPMLYKLLKHHYSQANATSTTHSKYPVSCVWIELPPCGVDFNVNPDKTLIFLTDKEHVVTALESVLVDFYGTSLIESKTRRKNTEWNNGTESIPARDGVNENDITRTTADFGCSPAASGGANGFPGAAWNSIDELWEKEIGLDEIEPSSTSVVELQQSVKPGGDRSDDTQANANTGSAKKTKWTLLARDDDKWSRGCMTSEKGELIQPVRMPTAASRPKRQMTFDDYNSDNSCVEESPAKKINSTNGSKDHGVSSAKKMARSCKLRTTFEGQLRKENVKTMQGAKQNCGSVIRPIISPKAPIRTIPVGEIQLDVGKLQEYLYRWNTTASSGNSTLSVQSQPSQLDTEIIGRLNNGFWIIHRSQRLEIVNHFRLWESVIYEELLETFQLAAKPLKTMYLITEREIGNKEWCTLVELSSRHKQADHVGPKSYFLDRRITHNGFSIAIFEAPEGDGVALYLTGVANDNILLEIEDLKECVAKISDNISATLSESRPSKVAAHLKEMATMMSRTKPLPRNKKELRDLLAKTFNVTYPSNTCMHGSKVATEIHNLTPSSILISSLLNF